MSDPAVRGKRVRPALIVVVVLAAALIALALTGDLGTGTAAHDRPARRTSPVYRMPDGRTIPALPPGSGMFGG